MAQDPQPARQYPPETPAPKLPAAATSPAASSPLKWIDRAQAFLSEYAWFIIRNVVGWVLILASIPVGVLLPGPGGLPMFLIGFALVTFPGKRKLTARVLRGRLLRLEDRAYAMTA